MYICDHRYRHFHSLEGPVELVCKLNHCPDPSCLGHSVTKSPELEVTIALPKWAIGWDVLCWIGHRRCARHWSISQIRLEREDGFGIKLAEDSLARYSRHYQVMLAARQEDPEALRRQDEAVEEIILSIDGLQPEKGHETLYVVRELTQKRVWFAEALLSATADVVRRLIAKAKAWAERLGKSVGLWLSDRQDAFVTGIAAEFPGVPHRYCQNHFLRDVAKPVLEADSHTKVPMRRKVRGLRKIEQAVLKRQGAEASRDAGGDGSAAALTVAVEPAQPADLPVQEADPADAVVLDYCAAVRGILNDDQGGPLHPPGLRMAGARNAHNSIATNTLGALHGRLRGWHCRPFNSDTKIRIGYPAPFRFYYPDASVVCRLNPPTDSFQDEPAALFEVLSRSTRRIDEGEKKDAYLAIPTLRVYALIEQNLAAVVVYRRTELGFVREVYQGLDAVIPLPEIEIELPLAEIYEAVEFYPESDEEF
jgi:Uma2 family endonuclease